MHVVDNIVKILEGISYLATVALLFVALLGLKQISLSKRTLRLSSKRDALRITTGQVESFFGDVLNSYEQNQITKEDQDLIKSVVLTKMNVPDWAKLSKILPDLKLDTKKGRESYIELLHKAFSNKRVAFNKIEAFSSTFTSGLGDEKTAYAALGKAYCSVIESYIKLLRIFNTEGYYKNTITLYTLWSLRLIKEELEADIEGVDLDITNIERQSKEQRDKLKELKVKISKIEDSEILSIGVDD